MNKLVWFDIDNTPHVLILTPFIEEFQRLGFKTLVTVRDYGKTIDLIKKVGLDFKVVGEYGGKSKIAKISSLLNRSFQLIKIIRKYSRPVLCLSHGSRSLCLVSKFLNLNNITLFDYEFTELNIIKYCSKKVFVPDKINLNYLFEKVGFDKSKVNVFEGLKEDLYLWRWKPKEIFFPNANNKIIVVLRPPSFTANYFTKKNKKIFYDILERLKKETNIYIVCLPRDKEQEKLLLNEYGDVSHFYFPKYPLWGPDLLYSADVVISGGGTMNREAVFYGCKVFSIFQGKKGGIDLYLEKKGKIKLISSSKDLSFSKKNRKVFPNDKTKFTNLIQCLLKEIKEVKE